MKNNKNNRIASVIFTVIALIASGVLAYNGTNSADKPKTAYDESYSYTYNIPDAESEDYYTFRYNSDLSDHYKKHKADTQTSSKEEYLYRANYVINNKDSLHKTEKEDGDDIYYLVSTNELVIVSTDGYIRTYFCPDGGKAYFDKQ